MDIYLWIFIYLWQCQWGNLRVNKFDLITHILLTTTLSQIPIHYTAFDQFNKPSFMFSRHVLVVCDTGWRLAPDTRPHGPHPIPGSRVNLSKLESCHRHHHQSPCCCELWLLLLLDLYNGDVTLTAELPVQSRGQRRQGWQAYYWITLTIIIIDSIWHDNNKIIIASYHP